MSEVSKGTDELALTQKQREIREGEYIKQKETLCNSTKEQLGELKNECSIEKNNEKENDANELLNNSINQVISTYLEKINSPEGINLSKEGIYNEVINILDGIQESLDNDNIFKNDIIVIKNNFLLPPEKGISLIEFTINQKLSQNNNESVDINKENIDGYFQILESFLGTLYDIGKNKNPAELTKYLEQINSDNEIIKIFNEFPDLKEILFNIIPSFINSSDKEVFLGGINNLLKSIKGDIIVFGEHINGNSEISDKKLNDSKLNIWNNTTIYLRTLLNKQSVDELTKNISKLKIISKDPIINDILEIINNNNFPKENKLILVDKILEGIEILSIKDLTDEKINEYANSFISLILETTHNINDDKIIGLINKINGNNDNDNEKIDIDVSIKELSIYLWKNKENILAIGNEVINKWFEGENISLNILIVELLKNDNISKSLNLLGKQLVDNLKKIVKIDLTSYALQFRNKLLENSHLSRKDINKTKISKLESNLIDGFLGKMEKSVISKFKEKFESKDNNNLQKEEIIGLVLNDLKDFLNNNTDLIFNYANELGISVEGKENKNNILNLINKILDNPQLINIISTVISNIGKEFKGKENIIGKLNSIIKETINNKGGNILKGTTNDITDIGVDTFYNDILGNPSNIETILSFFGDNFEIPEAVNKETIIKLSNIFKKHIKGDTLKNSLKLIDLNNLQNEILDIGKNVYSSINDKTLFINELLNTGVIKQIQSVDGYDKYEKQVTEKLDVKIVNTGIDLLYTTLESSNEDKLAQTFINGLNKLGLSEFTKIKVLGKDIGENIIALLHSVDKSDLKEFILNNSETLFNILNGKVDTSKINDIYGTLGVELIKIIDMEIFKKEYEGENIDSNEKTALSLTDEFQEVINENGNLVKSLISKGTDIKKIYDGEIDINDADPESIKSYGMNVYDLLNSVVIKLDETYLSKNISLPNGNGEKNQIVDTFISSFIGENKLFLMKEVLAGAFSFDLSVGGGIDTYFLESEKNRTNFGETLYSFLKSK